MKLSQRICHPRLLVTLSTIVCLGVAFLLIHPVYAVPPTSPSISQNPSSPQGTSAMVSTASDPDAAASYWTPQRQEGAISADTSIQDQQAPPAQNLQASPTPGNREARSHPSTMSSRMSTLPTGFSQSSDTVPYPYAYPASAIGKVFYINPADGKDYTCSGTVIASNNKNTIDTAGHCVADAGKHLFYKNWSFCPQDHPQYRLGCPAGNLWTARLLLADPNWYNNGWHTYDYGAAVVKPNGHGNVADFAGAAGYTYDQPRDQQYTQLGFPGSLYSVSMTECSASFSGSGQPDPGPATVGVSCRLGAGASGGAWLISHDGDMYLNGHVSYHNDGDLTHEYSPYFGDDWLNLIDQAQNS